LKKLTTIVMAVFLLAGVFQLQAQTNQNLTFQVNMTIQIQKGNFNPASGTLSVAGSFQGWSADNPSYMLTDGDSDGIYTLTTQVTGDAATEIQYKFIMNGGWESVDNRKFTLTGSDAVLDVVYFNNEDVYVVPVNVTFLLDMQVKIEEGLFDPASETIVVAGSFNGWNSANTNYFTDSNADSVYECTWAMNPSQDIYYKFVIGTGGWESVDNRHAVIGTNDTTLAVVYYDNDNSVSIIMDGNIEFVVNMSVMTDMGIFNPLTDSLRVRGDFNGWGDSDPAKSWMNQDVLDQNVYYITVPFTQIPSDENKFFKFYVKKSGSPTWTDGYERPNSQGGGNRDVTLDQGLVEVYYDDILPEYVLPAGNGLDVTFNVDMNDVPDFDPATNDTVWWICEQPSFVITQGWEDTDNMKVLALEDLDGDKIYSGTLHVSTPGFNSFQYRYAYYDQSASSWVHESSGFSDFAYRVRYVGQDAANHFPVNPWPMPTDTWTPGEKKTDQEVDPYQSYQDYLSSVDDQDNNVAAYELSQNYPNPFNPTTNITVKLAKAGTVKLTVYNALGQKVATIFDGLQSRGLQVYTWNGKTGLGQPAASGLYFYKLEAGDHVSIKKMVLMK